MWQIVLAEVGKGVLQGLGAALFSSVFGGSGQPNYGTIIANALEHFARELKRSFREELERHEFREALRSLEAAQRKTRQYNLSPETRKDLLDEITVDLSDVITNLEALGPTGIASYILGTALEVAIIQERAKVIDNADLIVAVCDTVPRAESHYTATVNEMKAWNESRFSPIVVRTLYGGHGGEISGFIYSYTFEGNTYRDGLSAQEAEAGETSNLGEERRMHIDEEWSKIERSLQPVKETLNRLVEWAANTGIACPRTSLRSIDPMTLLKQR